METPLPLTAEDFMEIYLDKYGHGDVKTMVIEFAKLKVQEALEAAVENAKLINIKGMNCGDHTPYRGPCGNCGSYHNYEITIGQRLDKESILNSYPLSNII